MTFDPAVFPRQLRYWALHCLLNAAPSLGIALGWMGLWKVPAAVAAMFAAIATMIVLAYSRPYAEHRDILKGEIFTLSLFSLLGIDAVAQVQMRRV